MKNKIRIGFVILISIFFVGCAKKPSPYYAQISNKPAPSSIRYVNSAGMKHPNQIVPNIHWRCTVGSPHHTWHAEAAALVTAQMKAKHLCEQLSNGRGICRYKGCVQVES